jgi:hypothetical protein
VLALVMAPLGLMVYSNFVHHLYGGFYRIEPPSETRKAAASIFLVCLGVVLLVIACLRAWWLARCTLKRALELLWLWLLLLLAVVIAQVRACVRACMRCICVEQPIAVCEYGCDSCPSIIFAILVTMLVCSSPCVARFSAAPEAPEQLQPAPGVQGE